MLSGARLFLFAMNHLLLAIGLSCLARVASRTPSTYFVNPPAAGDALFFAENKAYAVGSSIDVQWVTDQESYDIFLWQQSLGVEFATEGSSPIYSKSKSSKSPCITPIAIRNASADLDPP